MVLGLLLPEPLLDLTFPSQPDIAALSRCEVLTYYYMITAEWGEPHSGRALTCLLSPLTCFPSFQVPVFTLMSPDISEHTVSAVATEVADLNLI